MSMNNDAVYAWYISSYSGSSHILRTTPENIQPLNLELTLQ